MDDTAGSQQNGEELSLPDPYRPPVPVDAESFAAPQPSKPRFWTAIAVPAVSFFIFIIASGFMLVVGMRVVIGRFEPWMLQDAETIGIVSKSLLGLVCIIVVPQIALVAPSILAAVVSRVETAKRLSFVRGHWPIWAWIAAAVATPLIGFVTSICLSFLVQESENLKNFSEIFRSHGHGLSFLMLALIVGVTPAVCEEILFRGYVQTRLKRSWGPMMAIFFSSLLFAIGHMDPIHALGVFPLGVFLGFVCWRSGSIYPAILGHFVNNVVSVVMVVLAPEDKDTLAIPAAITVLLVLGLGIIGMAAVAYSSVRYPPQSPLLNAGDNPITNVTG